MPRSEPHEKLTIPIAVDGSANRMIVDANHMFLFVRAYARRAENAINCLGLQ